MYAEALESRSPPPTLPPGSAGLRGSGRCCPPRGAPAAAPRPRQLCRGGGAGRGSEREAGEGEIIRQTLPGCGAGRAGTSAGDALGPGNLRKARRGQKPRSPPAPPRRFSLFLPRVLLAGARGSPPPRDPLLQRPVPRALFRAAAGRARLPAPSRPPAPGRDPQPGAAILLRLPRWGKPPCPGCPPLPAPRGGRRPPSRPKAPRWGFDGPSCRCRRCGLSPRREAEAGGPARGREAAAPGGRWGPAAAAGRAAAGGWARWV